MPLSEYFRILRRWGWVVVLMALVTAGSAYVFSKAQTPIYRSTVFISVSPSRTDLGLTQSAKTLLRNYVLTIDTETFAQRVINELELDRTAASLKNDVTIASDDSRFAIQIDVKDTNPDTANDIDRVWADLVVSWRDEQNANVRNEDKVNAEVVDAPRPSLFRPNTRVNVLAGGILGVLLGCLMVFAIEYTEAGVIRSPEDIERALSLSVLGAIPPGEGDSPPAAAARARAARARGTSHAVK
jgi:capsular polysaccharide biosynthesis protein